jgi:LPS sulfotransferase NodH
MRAKFVVFAQGRTGSTLLGDLLRSSPDVFFGDEILARRVRSTRLAAERMRLRHARHAAGFHVKIYQLTDVQGVDDVGGWLRSMRRGGWRVIALRRENVLRHVLSNVAAISANRYDDRSGSPAPVKLDVDVADLLTWMRRRVALAADEATALTGVEHLALSYEQDLQDPACWPGTMQRVFGHLDLPAVPVSSTLSRLNVGSLRDLITNYDEVKSALAETEFAPHLD